MKRSMLKVLPIVFMTIMLLGCASEGDNKIESVKNGVMNLDKSTTIGKAIAGCSWLQEGSWSYRRTAQGREIVTFIGTMKPTDKVIKEMLYSYRAPKPTYKFLKDMKVTLKVHVEFMFTGEDNFKINNEWFKIECLPQLSNIFNEKEQKELFSQRVNGIIRFIYLNQMPVPNGYALMKMAYQYKVRTKKN